MENKKTRVTLSDFLDKINERKNHDERQSYVELYKEIADITENNIVKYKFQVDDPLPRDFALEIFYNLLDYELSILDDKSTMSRKKVQMFLRIFNAILIELDLKDEVILVSETMANEDMWEAFVTDTTSYLIKPKINHKEGEKLSTLYKKVQILRLSPDEMSPYEFGRMMDLFTFAKLYLFRIIKKDGLFYTEDIKHLVRVYIESKMLSIKKYHHGDINELKQIVYAAKELFDMPNMKLSDFGLSYEELSTKYGNRDNKILNDKTSTQKLKELRTLTHYYFDILWKEKGFTRAEAYRWLQETMMMDRERAHIAVFSEEDCAKLILNIMHFIRENG